MKVVNHDMTTRNGFKWKRRGLVKCEGQFIKNLYLDCGLYGFKIDDIDISSVPYYIDSINANFLILRVKTKSIIDLKGKCKFPEAYVIKSYNNIFTATKDWMNLFKKSCWDKYTVNKNKHPLISFNNQVARGLLATRVTTNYEIFHQFTSFYVTITYPKTKIKLLNKTITLNEGYYFIRNDKAHLISKDTW